MNYYKYQRKRNVKNKLEGFSIVTWLICINIITFIIGVIMLAISVDTMKYIALQPDNIIHGKYLWTLLTHMFMHAPGFPAILSVHLMVNMFVLFSLGRLSERIIGRRRFLWFYIISGLFAGLLSALLSGYFGSSDSGQRVFGSPEVFMVGASGAIFAIAGLYVMLLPKLRFMIIFLPFFSLPAYIMVPSALVVMWIASIWGNWPIGNVAHFGGFFIGIIYGLYLKIKYRNKVAKLQKMFH